MLIRVVNQRMDFPGRTVYIGRPSPLGNPFVLGKHGDRAEVIAQYDAWLMHALIHDVSVMHAFNFILGLAKDEDLNLRCYCAPLACHGDVIKRELERRLTTGVQL